MRGELQSRLARVASSLRARLGCVISDARGATWAAHRDTERFEAASVIKVPTLLALAEDVDAGRYRWDQPVPIASSNTAGGSGVIRHLTPLPYTLRDLATLMIIVSDNRATNAIIDLVGLDRINAYIGRAGWGSTVLGRRMMDVEARTDGRDNVTSPRDVAGQFLRLLRGELARPATTALLLDILSEQKERDRIPAWFGDDVRVANKTGTLPDVLNDAGIIFLPQGPVVAVVLINGLAVRAEGMAAIQEIGRAVAETSGQSRGSID